jgi:serine/threonine-protein kinase
MIIGTPEYMAPEQAAAAEVDHRADVYAFGVLAYEMVTGVIPFHGSTALATLMMHKNDQPVPPSQHRPDMPPEVEALILHALEKDPQARQQSMAEMGDELSFALVRYGLPPVYTPTRPAAPAPWLPSTPPVGGIALLDSARAAIARGGTLTLEPQETELQAPVEKPTSRRRWPLLLGVTVVSVLAGLFVVWRTGLLMTLSRRATPPQVPAVSAASVPVPPSVAGASADETPGEVAGAPSEIAESEKPGESATPSPSTDQPVLLRSVPEGAEVFRGKTRLGVTPLKVSIPAGRQIEYRFQRAGYDPIVRRAQAGAGLVEVRLTKSSRVESAESRSNAEQPLPGKKRQTLKPDPF